MESSFATKKSQNYKMPINAIFKKLPVTIDSSSKNLAEDKNPLKITKLQNMKKKKNNK